MYPIKVSEVLLNFTDSMNQFMYQTDLNRSVIMSSSGELSAEYVSEETKSSFFDVFVNSGTFIFKEHTQLAAKIHSYITNE